jgi:hypothetical protein
MNTIPTRSGNIDPIQPTLYLFRWVEGAVESEWRSLELDRGNPLFDCRRNDRYCCRYVMPLRR